MAVVVVVVVGVARAVVVLNDVVVVRCGFFDGVIVVFAVGVVSFASLFSIDTAAFASVILGVFLVLVVIVGAIVVVFLDFLVELELESEVGPFAFGFFVTREFAVIYG